MRGCLDRNRIVKYAKIASQLAVIAQSWVLYVGEAHAKEPEPCRAAQTSTETNREADASFGIASAAAAGEGVTVSWKVTLPSSAGDRYLIVAPSDEGVRFSGEGFTAFTPQARAPRSIKFAENQIRMVIPLSGALTNPTGQAQIRFFRSGEQKVRWAIVEVGEDAERRCTERRLREGASKIVIGLGRIELLPQNKFEKFAAVATYTAPNGRYTLHQGKQRYQIIDEATGDLIVDRAGTNALFSTTGRFVSAHDSAGRIEIIDIMANQTIYRVTDAENGDYGWGGPNILAWSDGDSILLGAHARKGALSVISPLIDDRVSFFGGLNCNACQAYGGSSVWLDVDRLAFAILGPQGNDGRAFFLSLLETADAPDDIEIWDKTDAKERATWKEPKRPRFVIKPFNDINLKDDIAIAADATKYQDNFHWASSDDMRVTFADMYNDGSNAKAKYDILRKFIVPPKKSQLANSDPIVANLAGVRRRAIQVDEHFVTNRSHAERVVDAMASFGVTFAKESKGAISEVPKANGGDNWEAQEAFALKTIKDNLLSKTGVAPLVMRDEKSKALQADRLLAHNFRHLLVCAPDQGESDDASGLPLPVVSADRLKTLWSFDQPNEALFLARQSESCGTAPDTYGELSLIAVSRQADKPAMIHRIAFADADAGSFNPVVPSRTWPEEELGRKLGLANYPSLFATLAGESYVIILSRDAGVAIIFDTLSKKTVHVIDNLPNPLDVEALRLTADYRSLIQINLGGDFYAYNVASGKTVLAGRFIDDEIVFYDSAFKFDSTPEGADYVFVRVPGATEYYSLDQFERRLRSPGLVLRQLGEQPSFNVPISGLTPPYLKAIRQSNQIRLEAQTPGNLTRIELSIDGVKRREIALQGSSATVDVPMSELQGARWANFVAENSEGLKSVFRSFQVGRNKYKGTLRTVTLGVDGYRSGVFAGKTVKDLAFAQSDAARFAHVVQLKLAPSYSATFATDLTSADATRVSILRAIENAATETKAEDTLVLYFASHGYSDARGFALALPPQFAKGEITLLPFSEIIRALAPAQGRVVVFLDACHAAGAVHDVALEQLVEGHENVTVIAASKGKQVSFELRAWGGGAFTSAIVDALSAPDGAAGARSVEDLYVAIRRSVATRTGGKQTPWLRRSSWQGTQSLN
jgi:hypothetical protein